MNLNLRQALRQAKRLGFIVKHVRRTGEIRVSKSGHKSVTINSRRKSSPRKLLVQIKKAKPNP